MSWTNKTSLQSLLTFVIRAADASELDMVKTHKTTKDRIRLMTLELLPLVQVNQHFLVRSLRSSQEALEVPETKLEKNHTVLGNDR